MRSSEKSIPAPAKYFGWVRAVPGRAAELVTFAVTSDRIFSHRGATALVSVPSIPVRFALRSKISVATRSR